VSAFIDRSLKNPDRNFSAGLALFSKKCLLDTQLKLTNTSITIVKDVKFGVDFREINKMLGQFTDNFFNKMIGERPPFEVDYETTQMIMPANDCGSMECAAPGSAEKETRPAMQDMSAGCIVNFREKRERNSRNRRGRNVLPDAFDIQMLLTEFTTGTIGQALMDAAPEGAELTPTTDMSLITMTKTRTETLFEAPLPPAVYPQIKQYTEVELTNLATIASPLGNVSSATVKYGVYVAGYETELNQFFDEQRLAKGFERVEAEYEYVLTENGDDRQTLALNAVVKFSNIVAAAAENATTTLAPTTTEGAAFEESILEAFTRGRIQLYLVQADTLDVKITVTRYDEAIEASVETGEEMIFGPEDEVIDVVCTYESNRVELDGLMKLTIDMVYVEPDTTTCATTVAGETSTTGSTASGGSTITTTVNTESTVAVTNGPALSTGLGESMVFGVDVSRFELEVGGRFEGDRLDLFGLIDILNYTLRQEVCLIFTVRLLERTRR